MKSARPQLDADELRQLRWLAGGGVILVSLATVFYLDVDTWGLLIAVGAAVLAGWRWPTWPARVPRVWHRLAFPIVAAFFTTDLWLTGELLPATVRLDLLLLLYRAIIYRRKRDDLQVIVLGLFLVVVAGVLSVSLAFALHIVVFAAASIVFLLTITLSEDDPSDGSDPRPRWTRHIRWPALLRRVRQVTDWRVLALGGGLFAGLVGLSALLFLAIPRFQLENSFFLERFITKKTRSGFTETIRFGDVTEITLDQGVALSVDVSDRSRIPAAPYWRMLVLDEYREGTFRMSALLRARSFGPELGRAAVAGTLPAGETRPAVWTFYLESGVSRYLPLTGRFESLQFRERQNHRVARGLNLVALRDEPATMTAYRVTNMDPGGALPDGRFAAELQARSPLAAALLRIGVDEADFAVLDRVVGEIAAGGIVAAQMHPPLGPPPADAGQELTAAEFARRAEAWLGRRHRYSLQPAIPGGAGDPVVRWLASDEGGHCELFAGAFVLLARTAGYPARVVTGFRGGSWNGYSNNFTLRNADAHAWCEIFDATAGEWLRADATPGAPAAARDDAEGEAALARRLDRSWTARLDSLRVFWYRRIVNFDQQSQADALKTVRDTASVSGERIRAWLERTGRELRGWVAAPWEVRRALAWVGLAVMAGGLAWGLGQWRRRGFRWKWSDRSCGAEAVRAEAGRWLQRLRAGGASPRHAAERQRVWTELERLRFGPRETWTAPAESFTRARRVWRELRREH